MRRTMPRSFRHQQTGVALISTMLVFALVAILTSQMIRKTQASIQRTQWIVQDAQAWQNALGGEALARLQLTDAIASGDFSPLLAPRPAYPTEQGEIAIEIEDLQSRINLNNLIANGGFPGPVRRLLQQNNAPHLTDALRDWIDPDTVPNGLGGEDARYASLDPGYKTANRPLTDVAQLLALSDTTPEHYRALQPFTAALPAPLAININTASDAVLSAIAPELDGQQIISARGNLEGGFQSIESFMQSATTAGIELDSSVIATQSQWYAIKVKARFGERQATLYSRVQIDELNNALKPLDRVSGLPIKLVTRQPEPNSQNEHEQQDEHTDPVF